MYLHKLHLTWFDAMKTKTNIIFSFSIILVTMGVSLKAQVSANASKKLPDDLSTETLLFVKFDSVLITMPPTDTMSKEYYEKWKEHNKNVPKYNAQLREYASKYPFSYQIISMTDTAKYRSYGAKYMFWMNSFDEFTTDKGHSSGILGDMNSGVYCASSVPNTMLGIIELTSDKTYVLDKRISVSLTYRYDKTISQLLRKVEEQFGIARK